MYSGKPLVKYTVLPECGCPSKYFDTFGLATQGYSQKCQNGFGSSVMRYDNYVGIWGAFFYDGWISDFTDKAELRIKLPQQMSTYAITGNFFTGVGYKFPSTIEVEIVGPGSEIRAQVFVSKNCTEEYGLPVTPIPLEAIYLWLPSRKKRSVDQPLPPKCYNVADFRVPTDIYSYSFEDEQIETEFTIPILGIGEEDYRLSNSLVGDVRIKLIGHEDIEGPNENWYKISKLGLYSRPHCGGHNFCLVGRPTTMPEYYDFHKPDAKGYTCHCPEGITGDMCESCEETAGVYRYFKSPNVCANCDCSDLTRDANKRCDSDTGQCDCGPDVNLELAGRQCHWYVSNVSPRYGPNAGGTKMIARVGYLEGYGLEFDVRINGFSIEYNISENREEIIYYSMQTGTDNRTVPLVITALTPLDIGLGIKAFSFEYRPNPILEDIQPRTTILKGGKNLTVKGYFFDSVFAPKMVVYLRQYKRIVKRYVMNCEVITGKIMRCPTPDITLIAKPLLKEVTGRSSILSYSNGIWLRTPGLMSAWCVYQLVPLDKLEDISIPQFLSLPDDFIWFPEDRSLDTTRNSERTTNSLSTNTTAERSSGFDNNSVESTFIILSTTASPLSATEPINGFAQNLIDSSRNRRAVSEKINESYLNGNNGVDFTVGFIFDGYNEYRDLETSSDAEIRDLATLYVYDDPVVDTFLDQYGNQVLEVATDDIITMSGKNLDYGVAEEDYIIEVGLGYCNLTDLSSNQLACRPPAEEPEIFEGNTISFKGKHQPHVQVIAGNVKINVGYLYYKRGIWYDNDAFRYSMIALIVIVILAIIAIILFVIIKKFRQKKRLKTSDNHRDSPSSRYIVGPGNKEVRLWFPGQKLDENLQSNLNRCKIPCERLSIGKQIGKGNFGLVYKGQLITPSGNLKTVAVKTLKDDKEMSFEDLENFLAESTLMIDLKHTNVLSLIGVVSENLQRPMAVLPYMENGDLCSFVKCNDMDLVLGDILHFGLQIANGMSYLAGERFVHRDLAARNCMVDSAYIVKIADFGMSRDVYERDYYRMESMNKPLPMKWMAVESLKEGRYSSKSDVWSYGVTMWELLTRGSSPYPGVNNYYIKEYVMNGKRLDKPTICPPVIFEMMCECWNEDPDMRPAFDNISNFLEKLLKGEIAPVASSDQATSYHLYRSATKNIPEDYLVAAKSQMPNDNCDDYLAPSDVCKSEPKIAANKSAWKAALEPAPKACQSVANNYCNTEQLVEMYG
ncbi:hepatocyte growth factor receptor-like [Watersipora subatra]|uniref:hepatocyte growth factor receptor-like n=1 Tax=Watersipora subatra TaxID=2589382 RepID=UPI00355B9166